MALARETTKSLEERIKIAPGHPGNERALSAILTDGNPATITEYRYLLRQWLIKQGIPSTNAASAIDNSLVKSYCIPAYLRSWRNKVNPVFALLGGGEEETESDELNNDTRKDAEASAKAPPQAEQAAAGSMTAAQSEKWLKDLWAQIDKSVNALVVDKLSKIDIKITDANKAQIRDLVTTTAGAVAEAKVKELMPPRQIEILNKAAGTSTNIGLQHEMFPKLLRACQARSHQGYHLNVWLTGQPGSGKTHAAQSVAKALNMSFEAESGLDADFKVMGYRGPDGTYHETAFFRRFTQGGVMLMDEIDNFAPSALLALNSGTANDFVQFPHGMFKRHKDFLLIACANTWGLGATNAFVGRTKLDAASLDRFQPKINWITDEVLERAIAQSQGEATGTRWHDVVLTARRNAARQGLQVIISPRATFSGISLLQAGFEPQEVVEMTLAAGISPEQAKALGLTNLDLRGFAAAGATASTNFIEEPMDWQDEVDNFLDRNELINAIKIYRSAHNCDLYTAKDAVEAIRDSRKASA